MDKQQAIQYQQHIPDVLQALAKIHTVIDSYELDRTLYHLLLLRASQINRCGYCVEMHTREAREDGESNERLDKLIVWDQVNVFSLREKAAFAWVEALTELNPKADLASLRETLRNYFSDTEISLLTANIAMINLWNRVQISGH